jgi:hypothetical protein
MTKIPILSGIYADNDPNFRTAFPVNMEPVVKPTGLSDGYLRPPEGVVSLDTGPGVCRGAIVWQGVQYRVMGTKLVSVAATGATTTIGDVGGTGPVSMSYGFDYLGIASGGNLFFYDGSTLTQNTDPDLGTALDVQWIDGYFMTTDGENLVVTELGNPFSVNPLKYGSSEASPDAVVAVVRLGEEVYAVNRHSIEAFQNSGGSNFPFSLIPGATAYRGAVGTHAVCIYMDTITFVGSGLTENGEEEPGVYRSANGGMEKISTSEVDDYLKALTDAQLAALEVESRLFDGRPVLYVHLPTLTLCYDGAGARAMGRPIWWVLNSGTGYRARYFAYNDQVWYAADTDSAAIGSMTRSVATHWGNAVTWEFTTPIIDGLGLVHEIELVGLPGQQMIDATSQVSVTYTTNGQTWSQPRRLTLDGRRGQRIRWSRMGHFERWAVFRFSGDSNARVPFARLDANIEALAW